MIRMIGSDVSDKFAVVRVFVADFAGTESPGPRGLAPPDLALRDWRVAFFRYHVMRSWSIVFVLCVALPAFASEWDGCEATDYAPDLIPLAAPVAGSRTLRSISRDELPSLRNIDAQHEPRGWLGPRRRDHRLVSARNPPAVFARIRRAARGRGRKSHRAAEGAGRPGSRCPCTRSWAG
jgi:hypothetical protein